MAQRLLISIIKKNIVICQCLIKISYLPKPKEKLRYFAQPRSITVNYPLSLLDCLLV